MLSPRWATAAGLLLIPLSLSPNKMAVPREPKYRALTKISIGALQLTNLHVENVEVRPDAKPDGFESVIDLQITKGRVSILSKDGTDTLFEGELAESSELNSAGVLKGDFHWKDREVDDARIAQLRFRLKKTSVNPKVGGGQIVILPTTTVFLDSPKTFSPSASDGFLDVTIAASEFRNAALSWNDLPFQASLKSQGTAVVRLTPGAAPATQMINGIYGAHQIAKKLTDPLPHFIPNLRVESGQIELDDFTLAIHDGVSQLASKTASITSPVLSVPSLPNLQFQEHNSCRLQSYPITLPYPLTQLVR